MVGGTTFFRRLVLCAIIVVAHSIALGAQPVPKLPITHFTLPPQFSDATLSPDGRYLAALKWRAGRYLLVVKDLDDANDIPTDATDPGPGQSFLWTEWATNERLLLGVGALVPEGGGQQIVTRLFAVNADGEDLIPLFDPEGESKAARHDQVVDLLPQDPRHILVSVAERNPNWPDLYRVDLETGTAELVHHGQQSILYWMTDKQGRVRIGGGLEQGNFFLIARNDEASDWQRIWQAPLASTAEFSPIAFLTDPDVLLVESNHEGGPSAIYQFRLSTNEFVQRLFGHDEVDIEDVSLDSAQRRLLAVTYVQDIKHTVYLDKDVRRDTDFMSRALPGKEIEFVNVSNNGRRYVIVARGPKDPGHYYVFDRRRQSLLEFGAQNPLIGEADLAVMTPYTYAARDGLEIPAYLTVPKGVKRGQHDPLPAVIFPHGGPLHRDRLQYSYVVQFLANRGYAVFQMNFRGSSGYGPNFVEQGFGEWGAAMQDDITDGVDWLVTQGIADPRRICILGGSYGGYAALMGSVKTPDLYACAISLNGVADLRTIGKTAKRYVGRHGVAAMSNARQEGAGLRDYSPALRADEVQSPILLIHGEDDRVVPIDQSKRMAAALKRAGKPYSFVTLRGSGHDLMRQSDRTQFLEHLERFLDQHIGGEDSAG